MCGINGIQVYGSKAKGIDLQEVVRTRDYMTSRGPDGAGLWGSQDERVALAHRRLSILDLSSAGSQPLHDRHGRYVIVFNGEIYNYCELRAKLESRGESFKGTSDTEVLLRCFAVYGLDVFRMLRGMFAFAIWDRQTKTLTLARDPFGIKPLYYSDDAGVFRFASQVKALTVGGGVSTASDSAAIVGFLMFGSVPEPRTVVKAVRMLPAGCWMQVVEGKGATLPRSYHSVATDWAEADRGQEECFDMEQARSSLVSSVRAHLVSDVPVGAFLSAGVDSSVLVGLMRDAGQKQIRTVTLSFSEYVGMPDDEGPLAATVASHYNTEHHVRRVCYEEFEGDLPSFLKAMDQPTVDGLNTWFVSKAAREVGLKVAISGVGGDELFGGYPSFTKVPCLAGTFGQIVSSPDYPQWVLKFARTVANCLKLNPKTAGVLTHGGTWSGAYLLQRGLFLPEELSQILPAHVIAEGLGELGAQFGMEALILRLPESPFARVAALEAQLYMRNQLLRDTDWASMAHSLEVRLPLVDAQLLMQLTPLLSRTGRPPGKEVLANAPSLALPSQVANRPKSGFTTPISSWQRRQPRPKGLPKLGNGQPWAREWSLRVADCAFDGVFV